MKVVFFGTSNVALPVLEALKTHHDLLAVVTTPDAKVGKKQTIQESPVSALATDLKLQTFKPAKVKNNPEMVKTLTEMNPDIFVVVSYGKILPTEVINIPKYKTINVHFSMLPKYRGAAPLQFALMNGDKETGTTIFILDELLDHGPVLAQEKIQIEDDDTFITLSERAAHKSAALVLTTLNSILEGTTRPLEQDHSQATNTKILTKEDGKVDFNKTSSEIFNLFRAFYPWPGIWTTWNGQILKIHACHVYDTTTSSAIGTVTEEGAVVCGNNTLLYISELQLAGKNSTDIKSFIRGYPQFISSVLGK